MAHLAGTFRLGRDAEKITSDSGAFLSVSMAYDAYVGGEDKTQWVRATLGGSRAEKIGALLVKGALISAVIKDVRVVTFTDKDGAHRAALEGRMIDFDLISKPKAEDSASAGE